MPPVEAGPGVRPGQVLAAWIEKLPHPGLPALALLDCMAVAVQHRHFNVKVSLPGLDLVDGVR